jgi:hypothetical protein
VTSTLARRLDRVEVVARADVERRWTVACDALRRSLTPEQTAVIREWFDRATPPDAARCPSGLGHRAPRFCDRCIDTVRPPALLRAMHVIVVSHITTGSPVALPPEVARIYVDDPDAVPARPCVGCAYLLPMRAKIRPDGTYRYLASYEGSCPICERDTRDDTVEEGMG